MLASSDVEARLRVTADDAGFLVAIDDAALARELATEGRYKFAGPAAFVARRPDGLAALIRRVWQLSRALPDAPLKRFEKALAHVGQDFRTEVEALVRRRLGQTEFRAVLLDYWQGRCAVTDIAQPEHCVPVTSSLGLTAKMTPNVSTSTMVFCSPRIGTPPSMRGLSASIRLVRCCLVLRLARRPAPAWATDAFGLIVP